MNLEEKRGRSDHCLTLDGRETLGITGVEDVVSFDEAEIVLYTIEGMLRLRGSGLHINKLSIENGELQIEGIIDSLEYSDSMPGKQSFLSRLFG